MSGKKNFKNKKRFAKAANTEKASEPKIKTKEPFILHYKERGKWSHWKEAMSMEATYQFGHLARLCEEDAYVDPPAVEIANYDLANADANIAELSRTMLKADVSERQKAKARMEENKPKMYSFIMKYLSEESISVVLQSEYFDLGEDRNDPLALWLAVKATHRPGADAVDDSNRRVTTNIALDNCKQCVDEPIHSFYERWK